MEKNSNKQTNNYSLFTSKLNKCAAPFDANDVSMINFRIDGEKISVLLALHDCDNYFSEADKRIPILNGVYRGVRINEIHIPSGFDFRNVVVVDFACNADREISITLELYPECRFSVKFSFEKYCWSIRKIISVAEFWDFAHATGDVLNAICDLTEIDSPEWAKFEN